MIKKLAAIALATTLPLFAQAEVWKDYTPSEEVTELVVIDVKSNYVDDYIMQIKQTWVAAMEVLKERGDVVSYAVWRANVSDSPNVFLTATFPNMGAMQGSEARYDAITAAMEEMGMSEDKSDTMAKGYEDIREVVDYKILQRITYK